MRSAITCVRYIIKSHDRVYRIPCVITYPCEIEQETPLVQRKTQPAIKLPYMTSRVMPNTGRKYIYSIPLLYHSLSE